MPSLEPTTHTNARSQTVSDPTRLVDRTKQRSEKNIRRMHTNPTGTIHTIQSHTLSIQ